MPPEPVPGEFPETRESAARPDPPSDTSVQSEEPLITGSAPTYRTPVNVLAVPENPLDFARPGTCFDDFELVSELGAGAFGKVFLARQLSLDRAVALKITLRRGHEARTLANLEHDHIVRVFSETVDRERGLLLLCMQYVPGTTLARVIDILARGAPAAWSGRALLDAIDAVSSAATAFDPAALRDRELLAECDFPEAVCWIGSRLALALAHAHAHGVLHRDVKPANILLNRYGRPLLVDFNIAFDPRAAGAGRSGPVGGTLAYMAPEHLEAFNSKSGVTLQSVDERSDVYALGLVLFELLTGARPFPRRPEPNETLTATLVAMAHQRRTTLPPSCGALYAETLDPVLQRCLAPDPSCRYQRAADLAAALEGCRELHRAHKRLPVAGRLTRAALKHPFWFMTILGLVPHVLASIVNISYNALRITLSPAQHDVFVRVTLAYNALVYPVAGYLLYRLFVPLYRAWQARAGTLDEAQAARLRRRTLALPVRVALLSAAGWLPGGLLFPAAIDWLSGPLAGSVFGHFFFSFTVAGLIALTYSVLTVQFVGLRVLYPRFLGDGRILVRGAAVAELRPIDRRLALLQLLAGAIPLAGAVLLMDVGPEEFTRDSYRDFRLLVSALIILGMAGFVVALFVSGYLRKAVVAFDTASRLPADPPGTTP